MTLSIQDHFADPILDNLPSREIDIDNRGNSSELTDYQVDIDPSNHIDKQGVRFVDENLQIIDYWEESSNTIWTKIPKIAGGKVSAIRMVYGDVDSESNGSETFNLFDDFEGRNGSKLDNAESAQTTPTYDGSGQGIHPSVVYFSTAWNGYKYWMAMTPYPGGNDDYENPSILASNDGVSWEVPSGLTNPIEPAPDTGHYSDTELVYNDDTDELWCYYRWNLSPNAKLYLQKSSNGTSWGEKQSVLEDTTSNGILSPSVVKQGNNWYLWFVKLISDHYEVEYYTSTNGTSWTYDSTLDLDIDVGGNKEPWHLEVRYISEKSEYWMLYNTVGGGYDLAFAKSTDRTTWTKYNKFILSPSASGWDNSFIYRTAFRYNSGTNKIEIWYTGKNSSNVWHIGYTDENYDDLQAYLEGNILDADKWTVEKKGSTAATVELDGAGHLHLAGAPNVISSGNVKSVETFTNGICIHYRRNADDQYYRDVSLGYGDLVGKDGATSWWHTCFYDGYSFVIQQDDQGYILRMDDGTKTVISSDFDPLDHGAWYTYDLIYGSDGKLEFIVDGTSYVTATDTTYLSNEKHILVSQGEYSGGQGGLSDIDNIYVRKYTSPEPTAVIA